MFTILWSTDENIVNAYLHFLDSQTNKYANERVPLRTYQLTKETSHGKKI